MKQVCVKYKFTRQNLAQFMSCYKPSNGLPFSKDLQQWLHLGWLAFPVSVAPNSRNQTLKFARISALSPSATGKLPLHIQQ